MVGLRSTASSAFLALALLASCTSMDGRARLAPEYAQRRSEGLRVAAMPFHVSASDDDPISSTLAPLGSLLALEGLGDGAPESMAAGGVMERAVIALLAGSSLGIEEPWVTRTDLAHEGYSMKAVQNRKNAVEVAARLGVDAVLYGEVYEWDRSYYGVQSTQSVGLRVWLIDGSSGDELFFAERWRQEGTGITGGPTGYVSVATAPIQGLASSTLSSLAIQVAFDVAEDLLGGDPVQPFAFDAARGEVPRLSFAAVDPVRAEGLKAGERVSVVALGTAGAQVSFDLGAYRTRIPMIEIDTQESGRGERSTYIGTYVVQESETLGSSPILVHLERKLPDGRVVRGNTKTISVGRVSLAAR